MLSSKSPDLLLLFYEKDILSIDYQTKNLILYTNVSVDAYIYICVSWPCYRTRQEQSRCPEARKKNSLIRICATVVWIYSNVVVSIDSASNEFALLRIDRYQLALLISEESDLCLEEKKNLEIILFPSDLLAR
jgi:hypothetical protein